MIKYKVKYFKAFLIIFGLFKLSYECNGMSTPHFFSEPTIIAKSPELSDFKPAVVGGGNYLL